MAESQSNFKPEEHIDVVVETLQSEIGPVYYYSGVINNNAFLHGIKRETYVFSLNKSEADPFNNSVVAAYLFGGTEQESEMLRHLVLSFKVATP